VSAGEAGTDTKNSQSEAEAKNWAGDGRRVDVLFRSHLSVAVSVKRGQKEKKEELGQSHTILGAIFFSFST
jgi:hypothetical protein